MQMEIVTKCWVKISYYKVLLHHKIIYKINKIINKKI